MLFGFVGAIIAGFLLTAIPNWTGRLPIAGRPLLALVLLWVAARMAVLWSGAIGLLPAAVLDVGFFLTLAALAAREVLAANNRNVPVVGMVLLFGLADATDYAARPADRRRQPRLADRDLARRHPDLADRRPDHPVVHPQLDGQARHRRGPADAARTGSTWR